MASRSIATDDDETVVESGARDVVTAMMRPELIQFLCVRSLGALSTCASDARGGLCDLGAWRMLAQSRKLALATPARALELDARAALKSQALCRSLAASLSLRDRKPGLSHSKTLRSMKTRSAPLAQPDCGFTYHLRVTDDDSLVWEGNVSGEKMYCWKTDGRIILDLTPLQANTASSWDKMNDFLSRFEDDEDGNTVLDDLEFSLVAVRNLDQATSFLGAFSFRDFNGTVGQPDQSYVFEARVHCLRSVHSERSDKHDGSWSRAKFVAILYVTHDPRGGCMQHLELGLELYSSKSMAPYSPDGFFDRANGLQTTIAINALANMGHFAQDEEIVRSGNYTLPFPPLTTWFDERATPPATAFVSNTFDPSELGDFHVGTA